MTLFQLGRHTCLLTYLLLTVQCTPSEYRRFSNKCRGIYDHIGTRRITRRNDGGNIRRELRAERDDDESVTAAYDGNVVVVVVVVTLDITASQADT